MFLNKLSKLRVYEGWALNAHLLSTEHRIMRKSGLAVSAKLQEAKSRSRLRSVEGMNVQANGGIKVMGLF